MYLVIVIAFILISVTLIYASVYEKFKVIESPHNYESKSVTDWSTSPFVPEFYHKQLKFINIYIGKSNMLHENIIKEINVNSRNYKLMQSLKQSEMAIMPNLPISRRSAFKFVANVNNANLLLLVPNEYNSLIDFNDIIKYKVKIKVTDQITLAVVKDIIDYYPKYITDNIIDVGLEVENAAIYAIVTSHPNTEINNLLENFDGMHLITINRINSGDYFIKDKERNFFRRHPYYSKSTFDLLKDSQKYYPKIKRQGNRLYYPTLSLKYSLFSKTGKDLQEPISDIINSLINRKILTQNEIANDHIKGDMHEDAIKVYRNKHIFKDG